MLNTTHGRNPVAAEPPPRRISGLISKVLKNLWLETVPGSAFMPGEASAQKPRGARHAVIPCLSGLNLLQGMYYNLFSGDKADGVTIESPSQLAQAFHVSSAVETISGEAVQKISGVGKAVIDHEFHAKAMYLQSRRSVTEVYGSTSHPSRANIKAVESLDLAAPCKFLTQKYDLVSVEPLDKKSLQLACTTLPIDLVTLNLGSSSRPIKIDGELLRRAAARDVYIELQIAGALQSGRLETATAMMATILAAKVPRHMLVLSTGHGAQRHVPAPGQLVTMATLLGMRRQHAILAVSHNPAALLKHAALRRLGSIAVVISQ